MFQLFFTFIIDTFKYIAGQDFFAAIVYTMLFLFVIVTVFRLGKE